MKRRHLLLLGGAAAAGYLWYRSRRGAASSGVAGMAGLFFDSLEDKAKAAQTEAWSLYEDYRKMVETMPAEYAAVNPAKVGEAKTLLVRIYSDWIGRGIKAMDEGDVKNGLDLYLHGITELKARIAELGLFLKSAPAALAALKAGSATPQQAQAMSLAATKTSRQETAEDLRASNVTLEKIDKPLAAAEGVLKAVGSPLGITGTKGFFGSMGEFLTRMKWYAIAGVGIYAAIKWGPGLLRKFQEGKAAKAASQKPEATPPMPEMGRVEYVFANPKRRRRGRR